MTEKEYMHFEYQKWIEENIPHGLELGKENEELIFKRRSNNG